jgi:hypothetical protein
VAAAGSESGEALGEGAYVTLIVRLLVDPHGHLDHGEVVDAEGTVRGRFKDWTGLLPVMRRLVERADAG